MQLCFSWLQPCPYTGTLSLQPRQSAEGQSHLPLCPGRFELKQPLRHACCAVAAVLCSSGWLWLAVVVCECATRGGEARELVP